MNYIFFLFLIHSIKCYLFSVIIPIYNAGRYLDDSINSIINQTIGFNKIQIILVNDESTDNTEDICLKYAKLYKNNIRYIKMKHGGVSKARNEGMKYANGKYINFLDSDDKWDSQAFKNVHLFFKFNKNVDIVAGRIKNFELNNRYQYIDYKFKITRVVNLTENFNYFQFHAASCIFRKVSIINNKFDYRVIFAEDVKFVNTNLLKKPLLGVIREAIYYSRKRADSSSASQNMNYKKEFYFNSIYFVLHYLISNSQRLYNNILPFIQFYIAFEILFRMEMLSYKYLDLTNFNKYCELIVNLIKSIEDKYLLDIKNFNPFLTVFALSKKYNKDIRYELKLKNESLLYSNNVIMNLNKNKNIISLNILELKDNILHLECEDKFWMPRESYTYFCEFGNKIYFPKIFNYSTYEITSMFGPINRGRIISFDIELDLSYYTEEGTNIHFYIYFMKSKIEIFPLLCKYSHIPSIPNSYYISGNYIIRNYNKSLIIYQFDNKLALFFEERYRMELNKLEKYEIIKLRNETLDNNKNNSEKKGDIWLINDNKNKAGDNGEYFFRYLNQLKPKNINFYFIIEKNCSDYIRLKNYSNIIDVSSYEYLSLFLKADKIISSIADSWVNNPFGDNENFIRDLIHFKFIYLNNGISKNDITFNLNKIEKNFHLIISSSKQEYNSILNIDYGYNRNNVILAGMPKFDNLIKLKKAIKKEKIIMIFPSWSISFDDIKDLEFIESNKSESFKYTKNFKFYNNLINNPELLEVMNDNNYIGILCLNQNSDYKYFDKNKLFKFNTKCYYQELIVKTSLLITDYNKIFFDFGYIKTPIIYSQFDNENNEEKKFEGFFNYEKNGFGPVCTNLKCTIINIIYEIKNNCKMKSLYIKKITNFFRYLDAENNQRIFHAIKTEKKNILLFETQKNQYIIIFFLFLLNFAIIRKKIVKIL